MKKRKEEKQGRRSAREYRKREKRKDPLRVRVGTNIITQQIRGGGLRPEGGRFFTQKKPGKSGGTTRRHKNPIRIKTAWWGGVKRQKTQWDKKAVWGGARRYTSGKETAGWNITTNLQ